MHAPDGMPGTMLPLRRWFARTSERRVHDEPARPAAKLARSELLRFVLVGVPALGLSLTATTVNAYVPVLARELTSSRFLIGALVSGEGFVSLLWPIWIGAASDRVETRLGPRLPFMLASAPLAAAALFWTPFTRSIPGLVIAVGLYYFAYFTYYAPYRALASDLASREQSGRVNGIVGAFRGAGTGCGLVGGALLFQVWRPLPYWVAAVALIVTTAVPALALRQTASRTNVATDEPGSAATRVWLLVRDHVDIRRVILANVLWRITETGLRAFIVLYLIHGLRKSFSFAALAMGVVAAGALVAAPIAGQLADRYGPTRVMRIMLAVFGIGLWAATFTQSTAWLLAALPVVGFGGAMALSLPYAILMRIMPHKSHGTTAGLYDVSSGAGSLLGPLLTGAAIDLLRPLFESTDGYAAMWPVLGTSTLLSIALLRAPVPEHQPRARS